jgi:hypothetical protein
MNDIYILVKEPIIGKEISDELDLPYALLGQAPSF